MTRSCTLVLNPSFKDVGDLVQMRVNLVRHLIDVSPLLTELWGTMSRSQKLRIRSI